jgi:hypothetical protein
MKLELGSWRVWELWEEEWPRFVPHWVTYRDQWTRLWLALRGRLREKDRNYVAQVLHEAMDCVTEGVRLLGHACIIFGYTLAHVLVVILCGWLILSAIGVVRVQG